MPSTRWHALGSLAVALVMACGSNDAKSDDLGGTYPNRRPTFLPEGRTLGYVANGQSDSVSVLDLDALSELGALPVGKDPVDIDGPRHASIDVDAGVLYVLLTYPGVATSPHAQANATGPRAGVVEALALDDLRPLGALRVPPSPSDLALSSDHGTLAIAGDDPRLALAAPDIDARRAPLAVLTPASGVATEKATLSQSKVCVAPASVVFGGALGRAFVACSGEDSLAVVDPATSAILSRVPAGSKASNQPYALTRDASGERLALSNRIAGEVVVWSAEDTPRVLATIDVPGTPYFSAFLAGGELVVPLQNPSGAARVDPVTQAVVASVRYDDSECQNPSDARALDDGRLFLVCEGDHFRPGALVRLDAESLAVVGRVELGVYPDRLAVREP